MALKLEQGPVPRAGGMGDSSGIDKAGIKWKVLRRALQSSVPPVALSVHTVSEYFSLQSEKMSGKGHFESRPETVLCFRVIYINSVILRLID